jgi:hypothetical protein
LVANRRGDSYHYSSKSSGILSSSCLRCSPSLYLLIQGSCSLIRQGQYKLL